MSRVWSLLLAVAIAAALGCSAGLDRERDSRGDTGGSGGSAGTDGGGAAGGGLNTNDLKQRCEMSNTGPRMLRRLTQYEFQNTVEDIFPEITGEWAGVRLGTDPVSNLGFSNDSQVLVVGNQTAKEILQTAEGVAELVTGPAHFAAVLPCSSASADQACAEEFIGRYGMRLFRRPLTEAERGRYATHYASIAAKSDFQTGIKWTLVGLMQSPHAVYRFEVGDDAGQLSQHELATELAYTFAGTTPSVELLAKADANQLSSPDVLVEEARALLSTPRGQRNVRRFFEQWSHYTRVGDVVKTTTAEFAAIAPAMEEETRRFIDEVVFNRQGGVRDLFTASFTVINDALAQFYGFGAPGGDYAMVERPAEWGVGLLAQGSILAGNAQSDSSSPTLRGLLVYERLFCNEKPKPPPNVPRIEPPQPGTKTTRQRFEESHNASAVCDGCHRFFDPPGFAFEHFDEVGRYRADEGGLPIDTTGTMISPETEEPLMSFDGLSDLAHKVADNPEVTDCVSGLVMAYAYAGGGGVPCLAESARAGLARGDYGLVEYVARLAAEPHFTRRN